MIGESVERLTEAFYAWETAGRGWQTFDYPVRVEPAFSPFVGYRLTRPGTDDGRKPTWISRLVDRLSGRQSVAPPVRSSAEVESEPTTITTEEPCWQEFDLLIPPDVRVEAAAAQAWLCSLSTCRWPVAFELWGSGGVSLHLACDERDTGLVVGQAKAFFPGASIRQVGAGLETRWGQIAGPSWAVVEFGLAREFMVPLKTEWDGPDPLTSLLGGLAQIPRAAGGLVQVIFEPARSPWANSILRAVTTPNGEPFFADAPEITSLAKQKISSPLYAVVVRIAAKGCDADTAWETIRSVSGGLAMFGTPGGNELVPLAAEDDAGLEADVLSRRTRRSGMIWSAEELACVVHPPDRSVQVAGLRRSLGDEQSAPSEVLADGVVLGETVHRGQKVLARLPIETRLKHVHVVGASGTGKSTLLVNLILQDIEAGEGVGVIDPHGDLVDEVLKRLPVKRADDVILFDPAAEDYVVGWNILRAYSPAEKEMLSSDLVAVFQRLSSSWGDQMTAVLGNAVLAFLESERGGTLVDLRRFLVDDEFREEFLETVKDPQAVSFWRQEFSLLVGKRPQAPILTRLNTFLRSRLVRDAVTEEERPLDFRRMVDHQSIFLGRLSQGAIGQENAALLGAFLVSKFHQVSLTRQDQASAMRRPFFLYVDEFQDVATPSMATLFAGVRKYHLGVTVAHQDLFQLHVKVPEVERAVLANAHTRVCFRVAEEDARRLERGLSGFVADDLMNLKIGEAICRVGRKEDVFHVRTSRLEECESNEQYLTELRRKSFERYGRLRKAVEVADQPRIRPPTVPVRTDQSVGMVTGEKTRPESLAVVRAEPATVQPPKKREAGRGGAEHKYLQELIRQWGQERGFRATVEHVLPAGGRVDVLLERNEISVACEVAMTTSLDHETANVEKCVVGGFNHVVVVSLRKKFLKELASAVKKGLSDSSERVKLMAPEELLSFLDELAAEPTEQNVAGYPVRVRYRLVEKTEAEARKRVMTDIIVQRLRRLKGTGS